MSFLTRLSHLFFGFLSGLLWFVDWKLSVFLYVMFFIYEYVEEVKVYDEMYMELKEYSIGFTAGLITYIICNCFFHIRVPIP